MIFLDNVTKRFGKKLALSALTLKVDRKELFAFLGPNGAGKTTTIKLLCGLLIPDQGQIFVGGHNIVNEYKQAKKLIGYIPDFPYVYDKLTVWEFLSFIERIYEVGDKFKKTELIETFDLKRYSATLIENLSHGLRQRVVFAATFLHDPQVLIIDEPLVGLDPRSARLVKDILKQEAAKGKTIFVSTHTLSFAEELATRIAIIDEGKIVAQRGIDDLRKSIEAKGLEDLFLRLTESEKAPFT